MPDRTSFSTSWLAAGYVVPIHYLNLVYRDDGPFAESPEHAQAVAGGTSEVGRDRIGMGFAQGQDAPGRLGCVGAYLGHAAQEKREPIFPGAAVAKVFGERYRRTCRDMHGFPQNTCISRPAPGRLTLNDASRRGRMNAGHAEIANDL
jgi:hypothetical protein